MPDLSLLGTDKGACPFLNLPVLQLSQTVDKNGKKQIEFIPCIQGACIFFDKANQDCKINIVLQLKINEYAESESEKK